MDETTAAGVDALETIAHSELMLTAQQEDLLLQNRILSSRIHEERLARQKIDEDVKFLKHQLHLRDRRIDAFDAERSKLESRLSQLQKLVDEKDHANVQLKQNTFALHHQIDDLKSKVLELQRENRNARSFLASDSHYHHPAGVSRGQATTPAASDRRFEEMFRDKVAIIRLQKKVRSHFATRESTMQALETNAMEAEDARSTLANELGLIGKTDWKRNDEGDDRDDVSAASGTRPRRSSLVCFDSVKRHGRGCNALPYHEKLDLSTPQDAFVEAKINASAFAQHVAIIRQTMHTLAHEVKAANDKSLQSLYFIFEDSCKKGRGLLANPREDFEKEIRQSIVALRMKLHEAVRAVQNNIIQFINAEKPMRMKWALEGAPRIDFECQVDIPSPEDPRIAELREQLHFVNSRTNSVRQELTLKMTNMELLRDKAEVNTQYIQQKLFQLHDSLYHSLHSIYRHRYHWINRFANSFQSIDRHAKRSQQLEVNFNVKLGQAVDEDMHYLRKLADYFVSDELFGADLSAADPSKDCRDGTGAVSTAYLVAKRKDGMPVRRKMIDHARRLSGQMECFLKNEQQAKAQAEQQQAAAEDEGALCGFAAVDVESDYFSSANPTPLNGSLRDDLQTMTQANLQQAMLFPQNLRATRSANSSPTRERPQTARTRSGSTGAPRTFVPSRPPLTRKSSMGSDTGSAGHGELRRVNSLTSNLPMASSKSVLGCSKVTLSMSTDVMTVGFGNENEAGKLVRSSSSGNLKVAMSGAAKSEFGSRRSVNT